MKKRSIMLGSAVILAVLLVVGGTMAWFTAEADPVVNTFKAGTVAISINDQFDEELTGNVNPGDKYDKVVSVTNDGSKRAYIRVKLTPIFLESLDPEVASNVSVDVVDFPILDGWTPLQPDGYYYYKLIVLPGQTTSNIIDKVEFAGDEMDNDYQGLFFTLTVNAEAIQATNGAINDEWGIDPVALGLEVLPTE